MIRLSYRDVVSNLLKFTILSVWMLISTPFLVTIESAPAAERVVSFTLINANTDQPIPAFDPIPTGSTIDLSVVGDALNIRANTSSSAVGSVRFGLNEIENFHTESSAPHSLYTNTNGDYSVGTPALGSYMLTATPYRGSGATGEGGTPLTIKYMIVDGARPMEMATIPPPPQPVDRFSALVFSKTLGFRHRSIDAGQTAISEIATANNFGVTFSEDAALFTDANLAQFDVVVFLNTSGDVLDNDQQAAFERYIQAGNGFAGIHSATDTEYDWLWFDGLLGTHFNGHPAVQEADVIVVDSTHPSSNNLPSPWNRRDEWYNFKSQPTDANVLLRVDESSYSGGAMGDNHPIAWYKEFDGGRSWYTAMGHTSESFGETLFREHLLGGIEWAALGGGTRSGEGTVSGKLIKWHPITVSFSGPLANESDNDPNPFLDYRLQVTFTGPSGQRYSVPGFFAGDGNGGGSGGQWQARFSADEAGLWNYTASFRSGSDVAIDLAADAGSPVAFDGASGSFSVADLDPNAPGFLKWGRLDYENRHYLKFADGPYWIKGGTDSPENFFGYADFDNTVDQGCRGIIHKYEPHVSDWNASDPTWSGEAGSDLGKGIIGALNYLNSAKVNSIYFLPLNLGGDGCETYPFVGASGNAFDNRHYDISKLYQWNIVMNHAQEKGIALHFVLNETESGNELWLDNGSLGVERKLFYRELIARFGYVMAAKWNLSEENDFSDANLKAFADYISQLDWAQHQIAVHTKVNRISLYDPLLDDGNFDATSIQYEPNRAGELVETMRQRSAEAGRRWIIDMDENSPAGTGLTDSNAGDLRKRVLYDVYFSGGNIEWYFGYHDLPLGGDMRTEDFRTREEMWQFMNIARSFMEDQLPFWDMEPVDDLLTGESDNFGGGEVFAKRGEVYAIYLPDASNATAMLDMNSAPGQYERYWFNPRSGQFAGGVDMVSGGSNVTLGTPPSDPENDWVVLLKNNAISVQSQLYLPLIEK